VNIRDRIKELRRVPASSLRPNPKNWRTHPKEQADALRGTLAEIGFAEALVARELEDGTLELIDGHLRAETVGDTAVPVLVLDVDEAEADKLLATLDPLAAMATVDADALASLVATVETDSEALRQMIDDLSGSYDIDAVEPPQLPSDDREPFRQVTFVLHDEQAETVDAAIRKAKQSGGDTGDLNENGNANALTFICAAYLNG